MFSDIKHQVIKTLNEQIVRQKCLMLIKRCQIENNKEFKKPCATRVFFVTSEDLSHRVSADKTFMLNFLREWRCLGEKRTREVKKCSTSPIA